MVYIIGIIVGFVLLAVLIELLKELVTSIISGVFSLLGLVLLIALIVGGIMLLIAFPPLILLALAIGLFYYLRGKGISISLNKAFKVLGICLLLLVVLGVIGSML
ncbi:hypothetical protein [Dethiobacter alkaliphilus]|uniref:Uncharacterized protein n=1 Tax=Dethiobacter alkaliphilus AHT 1 TaxID=555088 RepID=C0GGN6_DETAL|nr:hypothetical protein [Dethiobacter alkaliphilus]EEG77477.1 conserved Hypothetical protein CBG09235 [Dethiobacter alkaliphilus AHT 1]